MRRYVDAFICGIMLLAFLAAQMVFYSALDPMSVVESRYSGAKYFADVQ